MSIERARDRRRPHLRRMGLAPIALLGVVGCSSSGKAPVLPSSSGQTAYAIHYNDELVSATKAVSEARAHVTTISSGLPARIDELKKPDWTKVDLVIDDSDQAGKSADFGAAEDEATAVRGFWDS